MFNNIGDLTVFFFLKVFFVRSCYVPTSHYNWGVIILPIHIFLWCYYYAITCLFFSQQYGGEADRQSADRLIWITWFKGTADWWWAVIDLKNVCYRMLDVVIYELLVSVDRVQNLLLKSITSKPIFCIVDNIIDGYDQSICR